jgi:hypothetical protein
LSGGPDLSLRWLEIRIGREWGLSLSFPATFKADTAGPHLMFSNLHSKCVTTTGMVVLHGSRLMEKALPPPLLRLALYPTAAVLALRALLTARPSSEQASQCPPPLGHQKSWSFEALVRGQLSRFLSNWPDRLGQRHWRRRFQIHGDWLEQAMRSGQPVILVSGHFGPFHMVGYFLRAMGYPAATYVRDAARSRWPSRRAKERMSQVANLPTHFSAADPLREVFRFLKQGNILRMAFDVPVGKTIQVPCADTTLTFATGSIRMAAALNAILIPYVIYESSAWNFVLHLGKPVPPEHVAANNDPAPAAKHILTECWEVFRHSPDQAQPVLLAKFPPPAGAAAPPHQ